MLRRLLKPFLASQNISGGALAVWALFLLGAPVALWYSFRLQEMETARRRITLTVTRQQALDSARQRAADLQLDVRGWRDYVSFDYNEELAVYVHEQFSGSAPPRRGKGKGARPPGAGKGLPYAWSGPPAATDSPPLDAAPGAAPPGGASPSVREGPAGTQPPPSADVRRGPPPGGVFEVRVLLISPAHDQFLRVRLNSRGRLIGWELGGPGAAQTGMPLPPQEAKELAEAAFANWLGALEAERLGEPEMERTERAAGASGYRFVWRARNPRLPDTEFAVTVQVQGQRAISLDASLDFSEAYRESVIAPKSTVMATMTTLRILLLIAWVAYACWRYTRRWLEGEAPHQRVLGVAIVFALTSALVFFLDSTFAAPQAEVAASNPAVAGVVIISTLFIFVLLGLMLGISYGSGEGEVREGFPGKMTSTDCVLTGRLFNWNVGRAVVVGSAVACWCFLAMTAVRSGVSTDPPYVPEQQMAFAFGRFPVLLLLFNVPVSGLMVCVTGLLLPLTFLGRHVKNRKWLVALLVLGAALGSNLYETPSQGYWNYLAETIPVCLAILAAFFAGDFFAAVVACSTLGLLNIATDLGSIVPYWQQHQWIALGAGSVPLIVLGAGAWLGRGYAEDNVRPGHAANLASRLKMQAELSAARQAQVRLMPDSVPELPGLSVAASCTPAHEVSGDFYDFLPMTDGRLAVVIGEGGNDGLASALTIALTKGYLLYRTSQTAHLEPAAILASLERVLGAMLRRESGHTSLALICLDPVGRTCSLARLGDWPKAFLVRTGGTVDELAGGADMAQQLQAGDALVVMTDGIAKLLERRTGESPEEVLRRAAPRAGQENAQWLHDQFLLAATTSGQALTTGDDITTVVLQIRPQDLAQAESAA